MPTGRSVGVHLQHLAHVQRAAHQGAGGDGSEAPDLEAAEPAAADLVELGRVEGQPPAVTDCL